VAHTTYIFIYYLKLHSSTYIQDTYVQSTVKDLYSLIHHQMDSISDKTQIFNISIRGDSQ